MNILDVIKRLFFPQRCICCRLSFPMFSTQVICPECKDALREYTANAVKNTSDNSASKWYIDKCVYYYDYGSLYVNRIIAHAKYVSSEDFLHFIGKTAYGSLKDNNIIGRFDTITFIPRTRFKKNRYGFDQSEELAKAISEYCGVPVDTLIKRVGLAREQKKLKGIARTKNVKGKFECTKQIKGKKVLLVDDVLTTGSTTNECAKMLKKKGADAVYVWVIAQ